MIAFGILLLCAGSSLAQKAAFSCHDLNGYYPDPDQCDKYYDCYRGEMTIEYCSDGLVFDATLSPKLAQCNYPFITECPVGSVLQHPQPAGIECPRQNGYFEHENPANCEEYYECTHGIAQKRTCHKGLHFDEITGVCQWESAGHRTGCVGHFEVLDDGFRCPENATQFHTNGHALDHSRYLHPTDCRMFYVCGAGIYPSEHGCPEGTVFSDLSLNCEDPVNVAGCEQYYDPI